ncbi:MAG: hypothetical protein PHC34_06410 [Candidatus Gastranaerophilales bacterium]|nr:hypothetical protein [Candidatus Gastranaerophilales bacterium]
MITLNQCKAYTCFTGIQREQNQNKENMPVLKQLNIDTLSFKATPKYVSQAVYDVVSKYADDNSHSYAGYFMKQIKTFCERGYDSVLELNAQSYAKRVEKENIKEVSKIINQVKDSTKQPLIKELIEDYDKILGKGS